MANTGITVEALRVLVVRYARYVEWARASGYEPLEWSEYKKLRTETRR